MRPPTVPPGLRFASLPALARIVVEDDECSRFSCVVQSAEAATAMTAKVGSAYIHGRDKVLGIVSLSSLPEWLVILLCVYMISKCLEQARKITDRDNGTGAYICKSRCKWR